MENVKIKFARSLAGDMTPKELVRQRRMTKSSLMKEIIDDELHDRGTCPECAQQMFHNARKDVLYCVICGYEL